MLGHGSRKRFKTLNQDAGFHCPESLCSAALYFLQSVQLSSGCLLLGLEDPRQLGILRVHASTKDPLMDITYKLLGGRTNLSSLPAEPPNPTLAHSAPDPVHPPR